jgi:Spy/CpxP family protein refolding chaperone
MKKMNWPIILLLLLTAFGAQAQQKTKWDAADKADKMSDKLYRELDLSKEQNKLIHDINDNISRRRDAAKKDTSLKARDLMKLRQTLDTERNNRFKTVLTPAQYKKWNDWEMKKKENLEAKMDRKQDKRQARKANR